MLLVYKKDYVFFLLKLIKCYLVSISRSHSIASFLTIAYLTFFQKITCIFNLEIRPFFEKYFLESIEYPYVKTNNPPIIFHSFS